MTILSNDYVEVLNTKDFEGKYETKVQLVKMAEEDRKNLLPFLEEYWDEPEILGLLEMADSFAITDWDDAGWINTPNEDPSYGVFLARAGQILIPEDGEAIWCLRTPLELKRAIKQMGKGEFI